MYLQLNIPYICRHLRMFVHVNISHWQSELSTDVGIGASLSVLGISIKVQAVQ